MLLIQRDKEYIAEGNNDYFLTQNINKARDFKWVWLFISKKTVLEGINSRFGNGFQYVKV